MAAELGHSYILFLLLQALFKAFNSFFFILFPSRSVGGVGKVGVLLEVKGWEGDSSVSYMYLAAFVSTISSSLSHSLSL